MRFSEQSKQSKERETTLGQLIRGEVQGAMVLRDSSHLNPLPAIHAFSTLSDEADVGDDWTTASSYLLVVGSYPVGPGVVRESAGCP